MQYHSTSCECSVLSALVRDNTSNIISINYVAGGGARLPGPTSLAPRLSSSRTTWPCPRVIAVARGVQSQGSRSYSQDLRLISALASNSVITTAA